MRNLKNWTEVTRGLYRYVIATIVVLKTIEVKRVIDFDGEEGYDWRHEIDYFRSQPE